ncbi:hypothetical protein CAP39_04740 [Sphingomonas sp. IBVSS1]|nr:hypothetical protein CAP39_04740 [Sphingomonas sp. IBVSS1]
MATGKYRLQILGPFALFEPDGSIIRIASRRAQALIALLAMGRNGRRDRHWLGSLLWSEVDAARRDGSLRRELSTLRRCLNPVDAPPLLVIDRQQVALDLSRIEVDALLLDPPHPAAANIDPDITLLEGIDLSDAEAFEDWLTEQRSFVRRMLRHARDQVWRRRVAVALKPTLGIVDFGWHDGDGSLADSGLGGLMARSLIDGLSSWSTLFVVQAGPHRPDQTPMVTARMHDVRYLLDGQMRAHAGGMILTIWLVDAAVGERLWSARRQLSHDNVFAMLDEIVSEVAPLIDSKIEKHERQLAVQRPITAPEAHHLYWRANADIRLWQPDSTARARDMARQVLVIEPGNAWAASLLAFANAVALINGWAADPMTALQEAQIHYQLALAAGSGDPMVLSNLAATLIGTGGQLDEAQSLIERAIALGPTMPGCRFWAGWIALARGRAGDAMRQLELALRHNPELAVRPYALAGLSLARLLADPQDDAADAGTYAAMALEAATLAPHFAPALLAAMVWERRSGHINASRHWADRLAAGNGALVIRAVLRHPDHQRQLQQWLAP